MAKKSILPCDSCRVCGCKGVNEFALKFLYEMANGRRIECADFKSWYWWEAA